MKHIRWQIFLGVGLIITSAILYYLHFILFKDAHHIWLYLVSDIAFVPIEVLLVTLIIHRLLEASEKKARLEKINMVIEGFFSEAGLELLERFHATETIKEDTEKFFDKINTWEKKDYITARKTHKALDINSGWDEKQMEEMRKFLIEKRPFLLRQWENPNILEHESYSDALRATLHLTEELMRRENLSNLTDIDKNHLKGDMKRAYAFTISQWINYMLHLKENFPYLYSLAVRVNPFRTSGSINVLK